MRRRHGYKAAPSSSARGWLRLGVVAVSALLLVSCATGRAIRTAEAAAQRGDWDAAVAQYRVALGRSPDRVDLKIALTRATQMAVAAHLQRALDYEALDQLSGAAAEYRLAAELDPSNRLAAQKAVALEQRIRDAVEAARPPARIETMREQAAQTSPIPQLDPRTPLPAMRYTQTAVGDILNTISSLTRINIMYDQGLEGTLTRPYSIDVTETPLEAVLNQVLQANQLTYKVINPSSIFVYQDTPAKRLQWEDRYIQTFYLSHADPAEVQNQLNLILNQSMQQLAVRPVVTPNTLANAVTVAATAPVMEVIQSLIESVDKPVPSVLIEAEILEVNRNFVRQLGLDLNNWALGFTFSPEVAPPLTSGTFPAATPPPFNLNTVSNGISTSDTYLTSPTALIQLLESNTDTRVLARPQISGQAGQQIALRLGDQVPIPQTVFASAAAGGIANVPTTSVTYQSVGVNLIFTPRVTYQDEVILDQLTLEKSGLGPFIDVGGQSFPTIVSRTANSSLRLRDGESTVIAGLFRDDDRRRIRSFPGLSRLPFLGQLFGNTDRAIDETDLIMIITPRIIRPHEIDASDLRPMYIGTGANVGRGNPPLIAPEALGGEVAGPPAPVPATPVPAAPAPAAPVPNTPVPAPAAPEPEPPLPPAVPPSAAMPVPIEPLGPAGNGAGDASSAARIEVSVPAAGVVGVGSPTGTITIQVAGAVDMATVSLTVQYDPGVLSSPMVGRGSFMSQGGIEPEFGQSINASQGRLDIALSRPAGHPGASGAGILGALQFIAAAPGSSPLAVSGTATTTTGESITLEFAPATIAVR